jgi:hypothetical protein
MNVVAVDGYSANACFGVETDLFLGEAISHSGSAVF